MPVKIKISKPLPPGKWRRSDLILFWISLCFAAFLAALVAGAILLAARNGGRIPPEHAPKPIEIHPALQRDQEGAFAGKAPLLENNDREQKHGPK